MCKKVYNNSNLTRFKTKFSDHKYTNEFILNNEYS